jgi:glucan phosphoethanolaminetransferase (alkaline phosphatase superfamily)
MDLRYLKTNIYFLGVLAAVLMFLMFFLLRYKYPENFYNNILVAIVSGFAIITVIYYFPIKLPKSTEPFEDF